MDFSEKLLTLRKSRNLTQEELAEQLDVSRQSVSKWESAQAMPELDKIVALSQVFDVTTDYLLKPSDIDELSAKAEMLEHQQKKLEQEIQKGKVRKAILLNCAAIYLIAVAVMMMEDCLAWEIDFLWNIFPGLTFPVITLLAATACAIFVCRRYVRKMDNRSVYQ